MSPLEPSNTTVANFEYNNILEAQEKDHKIAFMSMIDVFKEEMNNPLKENYENMNSGRR